MYEYSIKRERVGVVETERNGYQWPASALGSREMGILYKMRQKTGKPITECLRLAVIELERE